MSLLDISYHLHSSLLWPIKIKWNKAIEETAMGCYGFETVTMPLRWHEQFLKISIGYRLDMYVIPFRFPFFTYETFTKEQGRKIAADEFFYEAGFDRKGDEWV